MKAAGKNPNGNKAGYLSPVDWLAADFIQRRERNPAFSLRAFARHLKISSGALSQILARKRTLTFKQATRIAQRLGLSPDENRHFLELWRVENQTGLTIETPEEARLRQLDSDVFALIADWYHYALLSLMETKGFRSCPRWMSNRLGISVVEARSALDRLVRLGLAMETPDGYRPNQPGLTTTHNVPDAGVRRLLSQSLQRAADVLEKVPVDQRDFTLITMAIDPSRLAAANQLIERFRWSLCQFLEQGNRTEVYNLGIQLWPLTRPEGDSA